MKKFCALIVCLAVLASSTPAWAVPAFNDVFKKLYVKDGTPLAEAKCNACHGKNAEGKDDKKVRNEFGKAVAKYLKKGDFTGDNKKFDPKSPEGEKALTEGLEKAAAEKGSDGKSFADTLKAGQVPKQ